MTVSGAGWVTHTTCVEDYPLMDGAWHLVAAERHGHNLVITVDDGDGWRRNESIMTLEVTDKALEPPLPLEVDVSQGALVGVWQESTDTSQSEVQDDLHICEFDFINHEEMALISETVSITTI